MKILSSPFKMEHFGCRHIGWKQPRPFHQRPNKFSGAVGAQIGCSLLPQIGVGWGVKRGVGDAHPRPPPPAPPRWYQTA